MTERARQAIDRHHQAVAAVNAADDIAGKIGPRFMQTAETLPLYSRAQDDLRQAELLLNESRLALMQIPSEEF